MARPKSARFQYPSLNSTKRHDEEWTENERCYCQDSDPNETLPRYEYKRDHSRCTEERCTKLDIVITNISPGVVVDLNVAGQVTLQ